MSGNELIGRMNINLEGRRNLLVARSAERRINVRKSAGLWLPPIEIFTASTIWVIPEDVINVFVAVVGAGGGAGANGSVNNRRGGGGGAGALVLCENYDVSEKETIEITIGNGGSGGVNGQRGENGENTVFDGIVALGGGGGGGSEFALVGALNGGSGGGGGVRGNTVGSGGQSVQESIEGFLIYGHNGNDGRYAHSGVVIRGGGGGGAHAAPIENIGGEGKIILDKEYAKGGNSFSNFSGHGSTDGSNGQPNTGSGGNVSSEIDGTGGSGGSGVVILIYSNK